jgi:hypothetical protein
MSLVMSTVNRALPAASAMSAPDGFSSRAKRGSAAIEAAISMVGHPRAVAA